MFTYVSGIICVFDVVVYLICIAFLVVKLCLVMNHVDFPDLPLRLDCNADYSTEALDELPVMENRVEKP